MHKKFITYCLLFFIPIIVIYGIVEYLTLNIRSGHTIKQRIIKDESDTIETLVLGSSQILRAVNPEFLDSKTLSLASGNQHHDTDFKILKQLRNQFPNLKTVLLEVSYSHFELPHNGTDFWKNSIYLKYYNVNCFERNTYFKDRLVFHSNPSLFSEQLIKYYIKDKNVFDHNKYGFNLSDTFGQFARLGYDEDSIKNMPRFRINLEPNKQLFSTNTLVFTKMLDYCEKENLNVVIVTVPMYKTYLQRRNHEILNRRDSVLNNVAKNYPRVFLFQRENDTINYDVTDFYNQSHLSVSGAKKTSIYLNTFLKKNL